MQENLRYGGDPPMGEWDNFCFWEVPFEQKEKGERQRKPNNLLTHNYHLWKGKKIEGGTQKKKSLFWTYTVVETLSLSLSLLSFSSPKVNY